MRQVKIIFRGLEVFVYMKYYSKIEMKHIAR